MTWRGDTVEQQVEYRLPYICAHLLMNASWMNVESVSPVVANEKRNRDREGATFTSFDPTRFDIIFRWIKRGSRIERISVRHSFAGGKKSNGTETTTLMRCRRRRRC